MHILRSRGSQDNGKASRHDPVSVAIPILDTRRLQSPHSRPSSSNAVVRCCCFAYGLCRNPHRYSLLYWHRWLKKRNLLCCAFITLFFLFFVTLLLISVVVITLTWEHPWTQILVREYLSFFDIDGFAVVVPGAVRPREPTRLWTLTVAPPAPLVAPLPPDADKAAKAENKAHLARQLQARYGDALFLYTFANGTERNHAYRRLNLAYCGPYIQSVEVQLALNGVVLDGKGTTELCTTPMRHAKTNAEVLSMIDGRAATSVTGRDRETDELRHSIRSVEQHVRWHRGRVVIVSPGHHPTWVDGAKNFLAGACGDASVQALRMRGTHLRLTTVHQDALMATNARLTVNTHPIEHQLWRVLNITAVHVYMNDDYFVNRDVAITDLFNEYGGTIVRVESTLITGAYTVNDTMPSWEEGVSHTNYLAIEELDLRHEDEVALPTVRLWRQRSEDFVRLNLEAIREGSVPLPSFDGPSQRYAMWTMLDLFEPSAQANITLQQHYTADEVLAAYASRDFGTVRPHFFATHAPFVYCTNMLRHFAIRYPAEYAQSMILHRSRSSADLYVPFLYNAFVMARPWEASSRFPAYLLLQQELEGEVTLRTEQLLKMKGAQGSTDTTRGHGDDAQFRHARLRAAEEVKNTLTLEPIRLDNSDGCAPATMLVGRVQNGCLFGRFSDNLRENALFVRQVAQEKPMFFNVNAGLTTSKAADQLHAFLGEKFPRPTYLEKATTGVSLSDSETVLAALFTSLMHLPVVGVVSYEEGACPLVRSLSLAFAGHHRGPVHIRIQRYSLGEVDATLGEVRADMRYAPRSAMATVGCTFTSKVDVAVTRRGEALEDIARRVLQAGDGAGVELPSTCGDNGGAGLRVRGFVIDARTPNVPIRRADEVHEALAMPGQTLALEDFRAVRVGPEERDVVLVLAREDAVAKAVHWITGASENDLLVTFPLPVEEYEEMNAPIKWVEWTP